ncbi:MAG: HDOD domain-containing protein [Desulfobacterales bacterium]|nr:MAG: HDOD domain-containing protein [Desulfobacterales bacterium]
MRVASLISVACFKRIQAYIARMPSLSTTVTKVLETCNNPKASPNDVNRVIALDPVLTGQVLRLINSAYYGLPHPITSLTRAIIMLGLNTVKNLALSLAILETMSGKTTFRVFSINDFWTHCLGVAAAARQLAMVKGESVSRREDFFIAGLLHDLGKIALNRQFPDQYRRVLELARSEQRPLQDLECDVLGLDHCTVGELIAQKWQLGATLMQSLVYHHHPHEASPTVRPFVTLVALANSYANLLKIGFAGNCFHNNPMLTSLLELSELDRDVLSKLRHQVLEAIEKAKIFLEISCKG